MAEKVTTSHGTCYMCGLSCPTRIHVQNGRAVKVELTDKKAVHCPRWKAQLDFVYHPDRLQYPLKRTDHRGNNEFERITWDKSLDMIAGNLQRIKDNYGPEAVVFYIGYTKEPRPLFHRPAYAFGSPNYCTESSNCHSATWIASDLTYGNDYTMMCGLSASVEAETKCKLIWGSSVISSLTSWQENINAPKKGLKLIVVDPRHTEIASRADIHLQPRPGTDGALALGMMHVIIKENLHDREFLENWTVGFKELQALADEYPPERVTEITWVPSAKIREAALLYAIQKPAKLHLSGKSTTHHSNGLQNHRAVILLAAITGNLDARGGNRPGPYPDLKTSDVTLHERVVNMPPGVGAKRFPIWIERYREMQSNAIVDDRNLDPVSGFLPCKSLLCQATKG